MAAPMTSSGADIVDLSERGNFRKKAASKLVNELVALGRPSTSQAPSDDRAILVQFTSRARSLM
jgi:DNA-binding MarR family transcriptional regulator